jgi:hypothetical protein
MGNWKAVVMLVLSIGMILAGVHWWNIYRQRQALDARQNAAQDFQNDFGQMLMAASTDNQDDFTQSDIKAMVDMGRLSQAAGHVHSRIGGSDDPLVLLSSECFRQAVHFNDSVHLAHALHPNMQVPVQLPNGLFECMETR